MIRVGCNAGAASEALLRAERGGTGVTFVLEPREAEVRLTWVERDLPAPFAATGPGQAIATTRLAGEFARYAGCAERDYLRLIALCGVLRARALQCNPLLRPDDFRYRCAENCVMSERYLLEEFFDALDHPLLCRGCRVFYGELCAADEVAALEAQAARVAEGERTPSGRFRLHA